MYEAFDLDLVRERVKTGLVLKSQLNSYNVTKVLPFNNVFEVESLNCYQRQSSVAGKKYIMKVYDTDEAYKFQNEVEKLGLLEQIMDDMGV